MPVSQSNLENAKYGYDLVVATTQDSINATMLQFLAALEGHELIQCYAEDEDGSLRPVPYERVRQIAGADPFSLPDGEKDTARIEALADEGIVCGFLCRAGLPEGIDYEKLDIIRLDKGSSLVSYRMCFERIEVFNIAATRRSATFRRFAQQPGRPWFFTFNVSLDLRNRRESYRDLPELAKRRLETLRDSDGFGVQQLYLDLNNAKLADSPAIEGLEPTSGAYIALTRSFIATYFDTVRQQGDVLLGYIVKPTNTRAPSASMAPTDFAIQISPHLDETGRETRDYGLYTLNYLIMSKNEPLPAPVPFTWNWVEESERRDIHGAMAVRRARFAEFLAAVLQPAIGRFCFRPWVNVDVNLVKYNLEWGLTREETPQQMRLVRDESHEILRFDYTSRGGDSAFYLNYAACDIETAVGTKVLLHDNRIDIVSEFECHFHLNVSGGTVDGTPYHKKITTSYQINADNSGTLVVSRVHGDRDVEDLSVPLDISFLARIITLGGVDDTAEKLNGYFHSAASAFENIGGDILAALQGSSAWVFPGGRSFSFRNARFSDSTDLTAQILYLDAG